MRPAAARRHGSGTGTGTATGPVGVGGESSTAGSDDSVVATASVAGLVSVAVGANQTISITFNSSDGLAITGFGISEAGSLPAGWSAPANFTCVARWRTATAVCSI